jgi:hypothetical protein
LTHRRSLAKTYIYQWQTPPEDASPPSARSGTLVTTCPRSAAFCCPALRSGQYGVAW